MITLYNSLTRKKEPFKPISKGRISMYVCGPTVYDVPHIGHARSTYVFDVIRRYFEYAGFKVQFVRNVTDIDDKIIKKATDELTDLGTSITSSSLKARVKSVAIRYLDQYHKEMDILGIRPPTMEPKATETIPQMIKFIERLIEKGYAYTSGGDVYFSVEKFEGYGKLSNRDKDELLQGTRKEASDKKRHPLDFALWKEAKPMEPSWDSPWGKGRPGWHIECSVMSTNLLGDEFDIHGGGLDLIFPHHENEVAQSEAATGKPFARYWMHNGLLTVSGEKMAKSLGNFITIADFLEKYKDSDLLKLAFLNSHYRSPMDYSDEKMAEVKRSKERIMIFFDKVDKLLKEHAGKYELDAEVLSRAQSEVNSFQERFEEAMNDDFNTPSAVSVIFEAVKRGNDCLTSETLSLGEKAHTSGAIKNYILRFADILGLSLRPVQMDEGKLDEIKRLVLEREKARKKKDYASSDRIRKELMDMGVTVEDTPEGPVWRKK